MPLDVRGQISDLDLFASSTVIFNASGICGAAGTACAPLYRTRERVRRSHQLTFVGFACGAAGTSSTPLYRTRERDVWWIRISNGSQNFGTAGRKWCSIIWNKSRTLSSAQTNYCPFGLPMFSLINSSYVRGSKAIRYRPSSNHKRCQLAICLRFYCRLGRKLPGNQSIWVPGEVWLQS